MKSYQRIRSPQTNRYIKINGKTYNELINYGYTEEQLLSMPRTEIINASHQNTFELTGVDDTDVYILSQLDDKSLVRACQTSSRMNRICKNNNILNKRITTYLLTFEKEYIKMKDRIVRAILALHDNKGGTLQYIKKYLETNYNVDPKNPLIKHTINMLTSLKSGERLIINHNHKGHYKVSKELRDAVIKK